MGKGTRAAAARSWLAPFRPALALATLVVAPAVAVAQSLPSIPSIPSLPSVPALPSAPVPTLPTIPSGLPSVPALPSGLPALPKPPGRAAAADGASATPPPSGAGTKLAGPPEDLELRHDDEASKPGAEKGPKLPPGVRPASTASAVKVQERGGRSVTIEELVDREVTSVSKRAEGSRSAPASIITITGKEIRDRGYNGLLDLLDDLPGVDLARPFGRPYVRTYWRGSRASRGADPYIFLLDGLPMNSLFFRQAEMLTTLPLTDIDHVEILYGPASVVHGANASAGMINIVTVDGARQQKEGETGSHINGRATFGGPQRALTQLPDIYKGFDGTISWITKDFRFRASARFEDSTLERSIGDNYELTKGSYYSDTKTWGNLPTRYPNIAGSFYSPDRKSGIDARLWFGDFEISAQYLRLTSGIGFRAPGDRSQASSLWTRTESHIAARHVATIAPKLTASSVARWRQSGIEDPSSSLDATSKGPRFTSWSVPASSEEFSEEITYDAGDDLIIDGDRLQLGLGGQFRHLDVPRDFAYTTYRLFPGGDVDKATDVTPPADRSSDGRQELASSETAAYGLASYRVTEGQWLHGAVRAENHSLTDNTNIVARASWVGTFSPVTVKALFAQGETSPSSFDLANNRSLGGTGLQDERATSAEMNATMTLAPFALSLSGWQANYTAPIVNGKNLDSRAAAGVDAGAQVAIKQLRAWAYYSRYLRAWEKDTADTPKHFVGDLALDKFWAGLTFERGPFVGTLMGRYVGARNTVVSNPIDRIPAFMVLDMNLLLLNVAAEGSLIGLRCTNLLDANYSHPGVAAADAGDPSVIAGQVGSTGDFNSRMPQPRRALFFTLGLER